MKLDANHIIQKIYSKLITNLNIRAKTVTFLEKNVRKPARQYVDTRYQKYKPKKMDKFDSIKLRNLLYFQIYRQENERTGTDREEIFALLHISDKGLVSKTYNSILRRQTSF